MNSPMIIGAIAVVLIVGMVVFTTSLQGLSDDRSQLTREQRLREDLQLEHERSAANTARDLDVVATILDPLGLFH